jgi:glycosyltransferase involved in cell wall biosynthesis
MNQPLINILIRTSGRPNYFNRCIDSIEKQVYKNHRILVSADSDETAEYVRARGITPVLVPRFSRTEENTFPWNLYLNTLKSKVTEGWIIIIDDDDFLKNKSCLKNIVDSLPDENSLLVYKMKFPNGSVIPDPDFWMQTPFTRKHIAMPCFCFHSKMKNLVHFDGKRAGDFRFINDLLNYVDKTYWLDQVIVELSNFGLNGSREDLKK